MTNHTIQALQITDVLKLELSAMLLKFESSRIGNDLNKTTAAIEGIVAVKKESKVSLIKRLFFTEYAV